LVNRICIKAVQGIVSAMAAYCDLEGVCVVRCAKVGASVGSEKVSTLFDARCNHEEENTVYQLTWCNVQEVWNLQQHYCEKFRISLSDLCSHLCPVTTIFYNCQITNSFHATLCL